jgi:flagellar basal body-associated protein FliL
MRHGRRNVDKSVKDTKQGSRKKIVHITLTCVATVAVIVATTMITLWLSGNQAKPGTTVIIPDSGGRGTVVMPENVDEIRVQLGKPVEDGSYRTKMNVDWVFQNSNEPSKNAYVENAPNNTRTVYFDLILEETNKLIYSSPFIPVGARLENFKLDAFVPAGQHRAIVIYHLVDDDHQELTTVSVAVTLHILE